MADPLKKPSLCQVLGLAETLTILEYLEIVNPSPPFQGPEMQVLWDEFARVGKLFEQNTMALTEAISKLSPDAGRGLKTYRIPRRTRVV